MLSATIAGHIGAQPEVRTTEAGKTYATFSVATIPDLAKKDADNAPITQWVRVITWGKAAEVVADHLSKGDYVNVVGKLSVRAYKSNAGEACCVVELNASDVRFGPKKTKADAGQSVYEDSGLPF